MGDGRAVALRPEDVEDRVREVLVDLMGDGAAGVGTGDFLDEGLIADSLHFMLLIMTLERSFRVKIPDAEAARLRTVAQVVDAVIRSAAASGPAAA